MTKLYLQASDSWLSTAVENLYKPDFCSPCDLSVSCLHIIITLSPQQRAKNRWRIPNIKMNKICTPSAALGYMTTMMSNKITLKQNLLIWSRTMQAEIWKDGSITGRETKRMLLHDMKRAFCRDVLICIPCMRGCQFVCFLGYVFTFGKKSTSLLFGTFG